MLQHVAFKYKGCRPGKASKWCCFLWPDVTSLGKSPTFFCPAIFSIMSKTSYYCVKYAGRFHSTQFTNTTCLIQIRNDVFSAFFSPRSGFHLFPMCILIAKYTSSSKGDSHLLSFHQVYILRWIMLYNCIILLCVLYYNWKVGFFSLCSHRANRTQIYRRKRHHFCSRAEVLHFQTQNQVKFKTSCKWSSPDFITKQYVAILWAEKCLLHAALKSCFRSCTFRNGECISLELSRTSKDFVV